MKLSFSTVGCPNWTFHEILSSAKDMGYNGIELRGLGEDIYAPNIKIFRPENLADTKALIKNTGLEIPIIASDCVLSTEDTGTKEKVASYVDLASGLGASYVRLLGDAWGEPGNGIDDDAVLRKLKDSAPYAESKGVTLLIETNGVYADSSRLKSLIERASSPFVQVLWDIQHPVRNYSEAPETTFGNIGKYIRHVHIKDSAIENGKNVYKMLGYGTLPISQCIGLLKDAGYTGYLSLEWIKRWNRELEDAGIVFSHFIYAVKRILK